mgnify:CR=1 FL=1
MEVWLISPVLRGQGDPIPRGLHTSTGRLMPMDCMSKGEPYKRVASLVSKTVRRRAGGGKVPLWRYKDRLGQPIQPYGRINRLAGSISGFTS